MTPVPETLSGWLGSAERSEALKLATSRGMAARATGLLDGELTEELRASFERTTQQVTRYLNVPVGLFSLLEGDCQMIVAQSGPDVPEILPAEGSMCIHVRDSGRDVIIDDLTRHELGDLASNMTAAGANAYMGTPVFSPDGQPIGSLCAIDFPSRAWEPNDLDLLRSLAEGLTDKIALIEAKARAEASEARLSATISAIPNVVYVFEPDGRIGYVSPQVEAQYGLRRGSLMGLGYRRHLRHEDARRLITGMRERRDDPTGFSQEVRLRDGGGVERELLASGEPFRDADGGVGYIVSTTEIGHLREAERALAVERGRLEALLEALPHIVVLSSPENGVEYVSPQSRAILGYDPESLFGFGMYDLLFHPEDRQALRERRLGWLKSAAAFEHEFRAIHADGREIPMSMRGFPLPAREGVTHSHVVTFTDLTDLRRAESAIVNEKNAGSERAQAMIDAMPIFTGLVDREGRLIHVSRAPVEAAGKRYEDVIGRPIPETWADGDAEAETALRVAIEAGLRGERNTSEIVFRWPGATFETEYHVVPIFDVEGNVTALSTSAIDRTEINAARHRLEAEQTLLRQIMDHSPMMKSLLDPEGRILFMNEVPLRVFGLSLDEIRGKNVWEVAAAFGPDGLARFRESYERIVRGESVDEEFTSKTASGAPIEIRHQMAAIRGADGEITSILSTAVDVTEQNRVARAVEDERTRLETVLDILPSGILIAGANGRITDSNPEAIALFGEQAEEGSPDAWPPGFVIEADGTETPLTKETVPLERALRGETVREARTIRIVTPEGEHRWLKCDAVPILDAEGRLDGAVMNALDITDLELARRETERERAESFARMERVIDSLPINVVLADKEGHLLYANEAPLKGAGVTLDDIFGKLAWESVWMPDEATARITKEEYLKAASGEIARREFSIQMGEAVIDIDHTVVPIFDADGQVEFLLPSSIDVTERNRALRRAEDEERRLRETVEEMPVGLFVFDRQMRLIQANEEATKATGMTPERLNSDHLPQMWFIESDGSETPATHQEAPSWRALNGANGRENRPMRLHHEGTSSEDDLFVRMEAAPLTGTGGEIVGAIVTAVNVKPLLEAEKALAREQEAASERLMATLEGVAGFVWLLDLDGKIVWCNRAFLDVIGLPFAEVEGLQFWRGSWVEHDPEMSSRLGEATCDAAGGEPSFFPMTARAVTGVLDIDLSLTPVRDHTDAVKYLVASGIEVTARNQAVRQIEDARMSAERAREMAERATRAKDEFLAVLSHELRTPLTPAMLGLELLVGDLDEALAKSDDPELNASITETMGSVRSNLEIQVRLIDDLLDVTRIARGKLELRKSPIDVHHAARHALAIVAPAATEKGIQVSMTDGATRAMVSADPARLRQILWNLLANAVKFTNPGGRIRVETGDAGRGTVRLKVIDDGLGIDQERLATIFDAFDQGDGTVSRGFGGLGLGLAIARSLARAHGGTLWATSAGKGHGATFVLDLPTIEQAEAEAESAALGRSQRTHAGCRVLLVEDNLDTARFTAALLRRAEVEVVVAHSVEDALKEDLDLRESGETWSAILTDIGLPDGDGIEVVRRLRAAGVESPAIAMSGYGRDEDKTRTADAGFRAHLVKPVVFERLLEVLDDVLPESAV